MIIPHNEEYYKMCKNSGICDTMDESTVTLVERLIEEYDSLTHEKRVNVFKDFAFIYLILLMEQKQKIWKK